MSKKGRRPSYVSMVDKTKPVIAYRDGYTKKFNRGPDYNRHRIYKAVCRPSVYRRGCSGLAKDCTCGFYGYQSDQAPIFVKWDHSNKAKKVMFWGHVVKGKARQGLVVYRAQYMMYLD